MRRASFVTAVLSAIMAVGAVVALVAMPCFQRSTSASVSIGGSSQERVVEESRCHSLIESADDRVIYVLLVPVLLATLYALSAIMLWKVVGTISVFLLGSFVFITGFSIGLFFAPAALVAGSSLTLLLLSNPNSFGTPEDQVT